MNTNSMFKKSVNLVTLASFLLWNVAAAAPEGGSVAGGSATIAQSGSTTTVNQTSQNAVINWSGFDTAQHEAVNFVQPNSSSIALNRINSGTPTNFQGSLSANGQVWILNPSGVLFGANSKVDVAGLLVTTHNITDANFMNGNYQFAFDPNSINSKIINNGLISAKDSGIVALVAPWVENNGVITAHLGKVSLSSGTAFVLDMYGDSLINFGSNAPLQSSHISNSGVITANGGKVHMTANSAAGVLDNIISMSGTIQAKSVGMNSKGEIILYSSDRQSKKLSGVTKVSGKLDTSSADGQIGGFIETSGEYLELSPTVNINAGKGGLWLLDPTDINIDFALATTIVGQLNLGASVTLNTASGGVDVGDITVASPITQTVNNGPVTLTLIADHNVYVDEQITLLSGGSLNITALNAININRNAVTTFTISTGGTQTYNGNIQLTPTSAPAGVVPSDILQSNGGDIVLNGPVTLTNASDYISLFLNAANNVYINGAIAMNPSPGSPSVGGYLDVTAGNKIYINTSNIEVGNAGDSNFPTPILRSLNFHSPVLLQQDLTITTSTFGGLVMGSTIDTDPVSLVPYSLTLNANQLVQIFGNIGAINPLAFIEMNTAVLRIFNATQFTTVNNQAYVQTFFAGIFPAILISLASPITFTSLSNGLVSFVGGIYSNQTFSGIVIQGNAYLEGNGFSNPNFFTQGLALDFSVTGATEMNNVIMNTKGGNQLYQGGVTVDNNASLSANNNIEFGSSVDGPGSLTTNAANTIFGGVVNGIDPLSSLTINSPTITLNGGTIIQATQTYGQIFVITALGGTIDASNLVTFNNTVNGVSVGNSGALVINGNAEFNANVGSIVPLASLYVSGTTTGATVTTVGDQDYIGAFTLTEDDTLNSTAGSVNFHSTVDGDGLGLWDLIVNAFNQVAFQQDVGGTNVLNNLDVTAGAGIYLNNAPVPQPTMVVNTDGSQTYNGELILTPISTSPTPTITLTASNAGADITFNGEITIPYVSGMYNNLFVNAGNNVNINGDVLLAPTPCDVFCGAYFDVTAGNVINIDAANLQGGGAGVGFTSDSFSFNSPIVFFQPVVNVLSVGRANFNSSINSDSSVVGGTALSLDIYDVTTFGGQIGTAVNGALASLNIVANTDTSLRFTAGADAITTMNNQDFHPPVFYFGNLGMTFTSLNNGTIHFHAENTSYYPVDRVAVNTNGTGGFIHVNGNAQFDGDVIQSISSGFALTGSIIVTGTTFINNEATIDSQSQDYQQAVTLGGSTITLNSPGLIRFGGTVDSANVLLPTSLVINGAAFSSGVPGSIRFENTVGAIAALNNLDLTANSGTSQFININSSASQIMTQGYQRYNGDVIVNVPATTMTSGADVTFEATVNGPGALTVDATTGTGNVNFQGGVGLYSFLDSLTVDANFINLNGGVAYSLFDQNYNGVVTLGAHTTLSSLLAGDIVINGTLNGNGSGPWDISVSAIDAVKFKGDVGSIDPLNIFNVSGNIINFDGSVTEVTTLGTQTYTGTGVNPVMTIGVDPVFTAPNFVIAIPLVIAADTFFVSTVGDVEFQSTIDGPANLTVTPTGTAIFSGDIGTTTPLESLTVNGTTTFNQGSLQTVRTNDSQIYTNTVTLLNDVELFTLDPGPFGTHLISFGYGAAGVSGPSYSLTVVTNNPANGPSGLGIQGTVDVATFIMGGTGGGDISPITVDSLVAGQGGNTAWANTLIQLGATGYYCVNNACGIVPPPTPVTNFPPNVPPTEIFNVPTSVSCDASGCTNLELIVDNLIEAGVVSCAGNGCPYGFVEARDTNGNSRILMQGGTVYAGDTIYKDKGTCVCVKAVSGKKTCYGPSVTKTVVER